jgi:diaminopimelate epimerase
MRLWRAHGLRNDYLVYEAGPALTPELVRAICDRHGGVGSDGVLEPLPGRDGADFGLRIHNPDGSEAEKSGNGLRIYAHWRQHEAGAPEEFSVWTPGGRVRCNVAGDQVVVDMGTARFWGPETLAGQEAWRVNVGNPHAVIFGQPTDWRVAGAAVEASVPGRTNVQFVRVVGGAAEAFIWERGAGETMSSGSSACAVAVVCVRRGLLASPVEVRMPGGSLLIEVGEQLRMRGPVEAVGRVVLAEAWVARARGHAAST